MTAAAALFSNFHPGPESDTIEEYHVWLFKQPGHTRPLDQTKTLHSGVADPISKAT